MATGLAEPPAVQRPVSRPAVFESIDADVLTGPNPDSKRGLTLQAAKVWLVIPPLLIALGLWAGREFAVVVPAQKHSVVEVSDLRLKALADEIANDVNIDSLASLKETALRIASGTSAGYAELSAQYRVLLNPDIDVWRHYPSDGATGNPSVVLLMVPRLPPSGTFEISLIKNTGTIARRQVTSASVSEVVPWYNESLPWTKPAAANRPVMAQ